MISQSSAWKTLKNHYHDVEDLHLRDLFSQNPNRFSQFPPKAVEFFWITPKI